MTEALVSTIIPVYNRPLLLREAVASVLAQTYRPIEVIIVDDGSTDETSQVADQLGTEHPKEIVVLHQCNSGPGAAREAGRMRANGEFIQYLDSDDLLMREKFELQVAGLRANAHCGISYGMTRYRAADGNILHEPWKYTGRPLCSLFPSMLTGRWWGTSTPLYRRSVTDTAGPWATLSIEEDWEYDCRIASYGVALQYVPQLVSEERDCGGVRLSDGGSVDPKKLSDRATAHELILAHARAAGVGGRSAEMSHFSRALFLLSRQCGASGLTGESRRLFALSLQASRDGGRFGLDYVLYRLGAAAFGWKRMGRLSCHLDKWRR